MKIGFQDNSVHIIHSKRFEIFSNAPNKRWINYWQLFALKIFYVEYFYFGIKVMYYEKIFKSLHH